MSLLTEKQIVEIIGMATQQDEFARILKLKLNSWNENQTPSTQFEPDWDNAPSDATSVYLKAVWYDREMMEVERTTICGWGRPITPHPHAEMIMKYAEVAARRIDPWVEFEVRHTYAPSNTWFKMDINRWFSSSPDFEYRHIGDKK